MLAKSIVNREMVTSLAGNEVLVIGDLMLDSYLIGDAERLSPEAPVPVVAVTEEKYCLGGAGNVARNVAALGGKVTLIGLTGKDTSGQNMARLLHEDGIIASLVESTTRPTTVKSRVMARHQQILRLDYEDTRPLQDAEFYSLIEQIKTHIVGKRVIIVSDYNKGLVSVSFMKSLQKLQQTHAPNAHILVDPKPHNVHAYEGVSLLTPNTKETGEAAVLPVRTKEEILIAGRRLLDLASCKHLLTTLGHEGMALFLSKDEVWHIPTMAQSVFDVTGAGDTVIATLGLALAAGYEHLPSCTLANYAAGLVVAQVGAGVATPDGLIQAIETLPTPTISRWC